MLDVRSHVVINLSECEEDHYLPLINLGESLQNEGVSVTFIVCAHGPCPGSSNIFYEVFDVGCVRQRTVIISTLLDRGLKHVSMLECVSDERIAASRVILEQLTDDDFRQTVYLGHNLWDIVKGTVCRYLLKTKMSPDDLPVIRRFFSTAILYFDTLPELFSSLRPDVLIVFNGMPLLDRVAREVATALGIRVFAEENSCFADRKFLDPSGIVINRHLFSRRETWDAIRVRDLDDGQAARLAAYLEKVYTGRVNTISQCPADSHAKVFSRLGFAQDRPLAILLSQVPFDSVIVNDSPLYSDIVDFIRDVMDIFADRPDWGLVVRLHPIEERLYGNPTLKRLQEGCIPENVRIVHGAQLNTYALMDCSQFALTINSQSGLEMLSKHKPVIVTGNAFYGAKGFTEDVNFKNELIAAVDRLCANPCLTGAQINLVNVFLYYFLFEYLLPYDRSLHCFGREAIEFVLQRLSPKTTPACKTNQEPFSARAVTNSAEMIQELYLKGLQLRKNSLLCEALEIFRKADQIVVSKGNPEERIEFLEQQTDLLLQMSRFKESEQINQVLRRIRKNQSYKYLELNPENKEYRFDFGLMLERGGEWREAWEQFDYIILVFPGDIDALFHRELNGKKAGINTELDKDCLLFEQQKIVPYIRLIVVTAQNGDLFDSLKKTYVAFWFCFRYLKYLIGSRI